MVYIQSQMSEYEGENEAEVEEVDISGTYRLLENLLREKQMILTTFLLTLSSLKRKQMKWTINLARLLWKSKTRSYFNASTAAKCVQSPKVV